MPCVPLSLGVQNEPHPRWPGPPTTVHHLGSCYPDIGLGASHASACPELPARAPIPLSLSFVPVLSQILIVPLHPGMGRLQPCHPCPHPRVSYNNQDPNHLQHGGVCFLFSVVPEVIPFSSSDGEIGACVSRIGDRVVSCLSGKTPQEDTPGPSLRNALWLC